jgi:hypothetical protein
MSSGNPRYCCRSEFSALVLVTLMMWLAGAALLAAQPGNDLRIGLCDVTLVTKLHRDRGPGRYRRSGRLWAATADQNRSNVSLPTRFIYLRMYETKVMGGPSFNIITRRSKRV